MGILNRLMRIALGAALLLGLTRVLCFLALRGADFAGYELLGAAVGATELGHGGILTGAYALWERSKDFQWWNVSHSFLFTFFPGLLQNLVPFELWASLWVSIVAFSALVFFARSFGLRLVVLGAALSASLAYASYFAVGYPYISGFLPYAAALVALRRFRAAAPSSLSFGIEILAALSIHELSFHCYEMGKTFGVVYLAAGVLLEQVSARRRVLWAILGGLSLSHVGAVGGNNFGFVVAFGAFDFARIPEAGVSLLRSLFVSMDADWPVLLLLAIALVCRLRRDRLFWMLLLGIQIGLLTLGAMQTGTALFPSGYLVPRRMLLLSFLCSVIVAEWWRQSDTEKARWVVAGILLLSSLGAASHSLWWGLQPQVVTTLPYVSPRLDFRLDRTLISDASTIASEMVKDSSLQRIFLYDFNQHSENMGDPQGFPERLLLQLGVPRFEATTRFLMSRRCRFWCLPEEVAKVPSVWMRDVLQSGGEFLLYVHISQMSSPYLSMLKTRGSLVAWPSALANFFAYRLSVAPGALGLAPTLSPRPIKPHQVTAEHHEDSKYCLKAAPRLEFEDFYRRVTRGKIFGTTFRSIGEGLGGSALSQWFWSTLEVRGEREQSVAIRFEGGAEVQLLIDHVPIFLSTPGPGPGISQRVEVKLWPGIYRLDFLSTSYMDSRPKISVDGASEVKTYCLEGAEDVGVVQELGSTSASPNLCVRSLSHATGVATSAVPVLLASHKPEIYEVFGVVDSAPEQAGKGLLLFDALAEDDSQLYIANKLVWELKSNIFQERALGSVLLEPGSMPVRFRFANTRGIGLLRLDLLLASGESASARCVEQ